MIKNPCIFIFTLLLCTVTYRSSAQTNDFGTRFNIAFDKDINKFNLYAEEELRTMNNSSDLEGSYTELGLKYSFFKGIKLGASYDFIYFNDYENSDYQPRHRFNVYTQGKLDISRFTISLRERIQTTLKDESVRDYKMNPKYSWRNKLEIEYNIKKSKLTPAFSFETFYQLNNPDGNKFDKLRYKLAFDYMLNKHTRLGLYTMVDNEINVKDPVKQFVAGLQYQYSFK